MVKNILRILILTPRQLLPDTGVDGSGNLPANLGGWGSGANGSYAPTSAGNGDCHSEDRMFKFFKKMMLMSLRQ